MTREDPSGTFPGALWPEQAITVDEAIRAYTVDAARALGLEDVAGSLAVGRSADFVELDDDPWAVRPHDIATIQPVATWFAGERVYRKATS
ncbi:putative amidohydrolase YtcJ [Pseudoclavibacter chungangensis]|nr:putative amidohydrolase YtcJ [Pseudoclavibacter chungangensis]